MKKIILLTLSLCVACVGSKGEEEQPLTDGKSDSFFRPTEQGALIFGTDHQSALTEDANFLSWTFTLSAEASLDIATSARGQLDTVMYLYRREPGETNYGRYIKKNDDDGANLTSRIADAFSAGEYRVIVKGFKTLARGALTLSGSCDGEGCGGSVATCDPTDAGPELSDTASDCADAMTAAVFQDALGSSSSSIGFTLDGDTFVPDNDHCSHPELVRKAARRYMEYEYFEAYDDQIGLDVEMTLLSGTDNALISVSAGGDEDTFTYLVQNGDIVNSYWSNQSPISETFCANPSDGIRADEYICVRSLQDVTGFGIPNFDSDITVNDGNIESVIEGEGLQRFITAINNDIGSPGEDLTVRIETTEGVEGPIHVVSASIGFEDNTYFIGLEHETRNGLEVLLLATRDNRGNTSTPCAAL